MITPVQYQGMGPVRKRYTTIESWRHYVNTPEHARPAVVTPEERGRWTPAQCAAHDVARQTYHRGFNPLRTPAMGEAHSQILLQAFENLDGGHGAKAGGAVDGPGTCGKTTIVAELGKVFELEFLAQHPLVDPRQCHLAIPVVYITLPTRATPKTLNLCLARFLNMPLPDSVRGVTTESLSDALVGLVELHGTHMIIVDDLHYLRLKDTNSFRKDAAMVANEHLKHLANILDVTFVYAGINLEDSGLFDEGALLDEAQAQTGGRFIHCRVDRFARGDDEWLKLLDGFEQKLILDRLEPGTLRGMSDFLYDRTQGSIGALASLLRKGANVAVGQHETLTEARLQKLKVSRNAEFHAERLMGRVAV